MSWLKTWWPAFVPIIFMLAFYYYGERKADEAVNVVQLENRAEEAEKTAKTQTKRAEHAEKQRDIANAAPASVDDMLDWLQRGGRAD